MPNSFDFDPRGPSNRLLFVVGACFIVVAALTAAAAVAKSKGTFEDLVRVDVALVNIGDGLPANSDVKFRDVLVGIRDKVAALKKQGRSLEEIVAAKPGARTDEEWGKSFMSPSAFVALVYQGI